MPPRYVEHRIVETLFELAAVAQGRGAFELFIGHPSTNRYQFCAHGESYEGVLDSSVVAHLRSVLAPQRRATLRPYRTGLRNLTLGLVDLTSSIVYISWRSAPSTRCTTLRASPPPARLGRILVLEDESQIAALISSRISRAGFDVVSCTTPADAGRILTESNPPFDLLISDLHLRDYDGRSFFKELRANGHQLPIIVLTAECDPAEMRTTIDSGIDAYLWKGSETELLLAWIRNLTNPDRARRFNV